MSLLIYFVLMHSAQAAGERSKTVILVKNLPAGVAMADLKVVFSKHGTVNRVLMPPSGITAIVEFLEPSEARQAFLKLNFSKVIGFYQNYPVKKTKHGIYNSDVIFIIMYACVILEVNHVNRLGSFKNKCLRKLEGEWIEFENNAKTREISMQSMDSFVTRKRR